jgi:hypothetical protein
LEIPAGLPNFLRRDYSGLRNVPIKHARTSFASSSRPFRISQRGDSGRNITKARIIAAKKIWKASGNETDELFIDTEFTAIKATVLEMATGSFRDMFTMGRPFRISQRGDSGRNITKARIIAAKKIWKASGNLNG